MATKEGLGVDLALVFGGIGAFAASYAVENPQLRAALRLGGAAVALVGAFRTVQGFLSGPETIQSDVVVPRIGGVQDARVTLPEGEIGLALPVYGPAEDLSSEAPEGSGIAVGSLASAATGVILQPEPNSIERRTVLSSLFDVSIELHNASALPLEPLVELLATVNPTIGSTYQERTTIGGIPLAPGSTRRLSVKAESGDTNLALFEMGARVHLELYVANRRVHSTNFILG